VAEGNGDEHLEDGWGASTPPDDTLLRAYVTGFARWMVDLGRTTGSRFVDLPEAGGLDAGSDFFLANGCVIRRPVRDDAWPGLVARLQAFYDDGPGGAWALFSPWPTPDLSMHGLALMGHPPFMVRPAGGSAPPDPDGLEIAEAHDDATMRDFARALAEGYPAPDADFLATRRVLDAPGTRCFVGYLDGRPVATSCAHVHGSCVHVEWIATHPDVRGRGIGAAITWRATLAEPGSPAALIASDPGQPVYERMGYLRIARFTAWTGNRQ
jgi:GNAT superfamily N-acetyltransferase